MEETLSFKRGSIDSDEEHIIWFTNLLHVPIHHSKESNCEIRKDAKRLSLGRGAFLHRLHLVNWAVVCLKKHEGGLSIRNLPILNKALLGKWS